MKTVALLVRNKNLNLGFTVCVLSSGREQFC